MGLRELAEQDLGIILEDDTTGLGWSISLTNPAGLSAALTGFSNDVSEVIDPGTGQLVSGRVASIAIRITHLNNAGFTELPQGIENRASKPWIMVFDDINGITHSFKVRKTNPDRALGVVTCELELYLQ